MSCCTWSLPRISSFLILSLLVTPSIFRRHVISNTLSLDLSLSFSVQVSELYRSTLFTNVSNTRIFVCLLSSLDVHILFSVCSMPLANPILRSMSFPDPSLVLIFPPRYTKFSVCCSCCSFTLIWNVMFPFPRNWISVFAAFLHDHTTSLLHIAINGHFVVATVARWYLRGMRQLNRHFRTLQSLYNFFWFRIEGKPPLYTFQEKNQTY